MKTLEEFYQSEWFTARPAVIKGLFYKYDITKEYFLNVPLTNQYYGVRICGWEEHQDIFPTARVYVAGSMPPITARYVFGILEEDIRFSHQIPAENILYHTPNIYTFGD